MNLTERIASDLTAAMKAKDVLRTSVLRMAKAALKNREIDQGGALEDAETVRVLQSLVKQREDSIEQFEKGNRADLAAKERAEIVVLQAYLPAAASDEDIERVVATIVTETDASSPKDLGRVMKAALSVLQAEGKGVDGKKVNAAVRKRLGVG